jgi:hypothetical protein
MTDEFDQADEFPLDDEQAVEEPAEEAPPTLAGPEDWPEPARAEVARLRSENAKYRVQRRQLREEKLAQTYGAEAVGMIPAEVTDPARREELAATYAERIGHAGPQVPAGLAAVAQAPSSGTAPAPDAMSLEEFREHIKAVGLTQAALQYGSRLDLDGGNPLRDGVPRRTQGTYKPPS